MPDQIRVLIVEDEFIIALQMKARLVELGYTVCTFAAAGDAAIRIARSERPDVVLMDVSLADRTSGITTAREISAFLNPAIIFISANSNDDLQPQIAALHPLAYFVKPVTPETVHETIRKWRREQA